MKNYLKPMPLFVGLALIAISVPLAAQTTGSLEFSAQVSPSGGRPEPVRELTFYLLRKSLSDIRAEAEQIEPAPDFNKFVDDLKVSPELKGWMKKHHTVEISGSDFTKSLTPDDIMDVHEFFDAYMSRNVGFKGVGFPEPKFKEKDREANPEKYKQQKEEYRAAIKKFIGAMPESVEGIDIDLGDINPSNKWQQLVAVHRERLDDRAFDLAEQRYLAAKTDTNLEGRGAFVGIAPGTYWISMIGTQAISGDVHLRWDVPVMVRAGEPTRVELTNLNAAKSLRAAQEPNP